MKDEGTAMNYRCENYMSVVSEKQESADPNGPCKHLKSTVNKAAEQTFGYKTREEVQNPCITFLR